MLSLVLPTYNEAPNVAAIVPLLRETLRGIPHEILIVDDDSPDRTWEVAENLARMHEDVRVIRRIGRRGLSSAVVEGFSAATGDVLLVMDADLQHDPSIVPRLYEAVRGGATLAVASRYVQGGTTADWRKSRLALSRLATFLAASLPPVRVSDPMSGFFAIERSAFLAVREQLRPAGFKILLEILSHLPRGTPTAEVPLSFGVRQHGESKLSLRVQMEFLGQLLRIALRRMGGSRVQWMLFAVAVAAALWMTAPRILHLRLMYLDASVRAQTEHALRQVAEREGWLLSDVQIDAVIPDAALLTIRSHHRGEDERECVLLKTDTATTAPC